MQLKLLSGIQDVVYEFKNDNKMSLFTTIDRPAVKEAWFVSADSTRGKCHCIPHRNDPERLIKHFYGLISSRMTKPPPKKQGKVIECFDEYENNMDYIYYLLDFGLMCFISAAELKSNRWGAIKPVGSGAVKPYYWLRMTISLQQEKKKMVLRCNLFTLAKKL